MFDDHPFACLIFFKALHWFSIGIEMIKIFWAESSEFGTYRLCEQRRFRRACASAQSRQNLRCSLIQAESQEEPSDKNPDPWPLWMAGHAQLKFVMTECSKTQIRLTLPFCSKWSYFVGNRLSSPWAEPSIFVICYHLRGLNLTILFDESDICR